MQDFSPCPKHSRHVPGCQHLDLSTPVEGQGQGLAPGMGPGFGTWHGARVWHLGMVAWAGNWKGEVNQHPPSGKRSTTSEFGWSTQIKTTAKADKTFIKFKKRNPKNPPKKHDLLSAIHREVALVFLRKAKPQIRRNKKICPVAFLSAPSGG